MFKNYLFIMPNLDDWHLKIELDAFKGSSADCITSKIEFIFGLVRNLNTLTGHVFIAKPSTRIITEVDITTYNI